MPVTFIHFEIEPATLQPHVPFALDGREGNASVSVVAFSQQKLRLAWGGALTACAAGSLDAFLLERDVAFTERDGVRRRFRVAHAPWPQAPVDVEIADDSLLRETFAWWPAVRFVGANASPGVAVTIGRPERLPSRRRQTLTRLWT